MPSWSFAFLRANAKLCIIFLAVRLGENSICLIASSTGMLRICRASILSLRGLVFILAEDHRYYEWCISPNTIIERKQHTCFSTSSVDSPALSDSTLILSNKEEAPTSGLEVCGCSAKRRAPEVKLRIWNGIVIDFDDRVSHGCWLYLMACMDVKRLDPASGRIAVRKTVAIGEYQHSVAAFGDRKWVVLNT